MKAAFIAVLLISALTVACGGGNEHATTIELADEQAAEDLLLEAVLAIDDMPFGWTQTTAPGDIADVPESPAPAASPKCPIGRWSVEPIANAGVGFAGGLISPIVGQELVAFPRGAAEGEMSTMMALAESPECDMRPLSFPKLGDETIALQRKMHVDGTRSESDEIWIRRGDIINFVFQVHVTTSMGPEIDTKLTETVARTADEKVKTVLER